LPHWPTFRQSRIGRFTALAGSPGKQESRLKRTPAGTLEWRGRFAVTADISVKRVDRFT
jgi:hypothetical protein